MRLCVPDFRYCAVGTSSANKLQPKFCGNGNSIKNSGLVCFERLFFLIHHRTDAKLLVEGSKYFKFKSLKLILTVGAKMFSIEVSMSPIIILYLA